MQTKKVSPANTYIWTGARISAALTAIIGLTAANLSGFEIVGKTVPTAYPWRLIGTNVAAHLTAWAGYLLHNILAWGIIVFALRQKPLYGNDLRWFNWALIGVNIVFALFHMAQTQYFYDGVPEITALGPVVVLLVFIMVPETPRRGLMIGHNFQRPVKGPAAGDYLS